MDQNIQKGGAEPKKSLHKIGTSVYGRWKKIGTRTRGSRRSDLEGEALFVLSLRSYYLADTITMDMCSVLADI